MERANDSLREKSKKVYEYLSKVRKASKQEIIRDTGLETEAEYSLIKKELINQELVVALAGRFGGLVLSSTAVHERPALERSRKREVIQVTLGPEKEKIAKLSEKARKIWNNIPEDGSFVTNHGLRYKLRPLGITTDDFWNYRKELLDNHLIQIRRGRGGSVARIQEFVEEHKVRLPPTLVKTEDKLWDELKKWLDKNQVKGDEESGWQAWAVVTATARRSGHWVNPDVVLVEVTSYEYLRTDVAVTTYEIKRYSPQMDNTWVFEAASHSKGAHYSYLVVENSKNAKTDEPPAELSPDLRRFGIGFGWLYLNPDTNEYEFEEILEPVRTNPDPENENNLLENFVNKLKPAHQTAFKNAIK